MAMADEGSLTRFANSEIHQNVAESNVQVNLRFVIGRRVGVASTNRSDDEGLRSLAERAAAIARNSEELEDWGGLPEPTPIRDVPEGYAEATAGATPELRAEGVRAVIAAADAAGVVSYGSFSTATETLGIANSKGVRASQRRTVSQLLTVAMAPDGGSGYAESAAVDVTAHRRRGDRPRRRPRRRGRPATRLRSTRASGRSSSRSTRSSTCSRCSATWASARSPSRRSGRSPSQVGASAATSCRSSTTATTHRRCRWPSTTRASPRSASR